MGLFPFFSKKQQDSAGDDEVPVKPRRSRSAKGQDDEPVDPMLPEKKRARRRLIGASALVLAAVIGLPMIFDSEPKPLADDIAIQIPPRDKTPAVQADPLPLPPAPVMPADHGSADKAAAHGEATSSNDKPDDKSAERQADAAPAEKPVARIDKVAEKPADKPADKQAEKAAEKPADKHPEKHAEKHSDKPADKQADKDKGRFVVQVAAVSSKAKAGELQNRIRKTGIKAYWQKIDTREGERFRVRAGPFGSRDEADNALGKLRKLGLSGTVQSI